MPLPTDKSEYITEPPLQPVFTRALLLTTLACLPLLAACGRGDGIERVELSGKVTFRGQPIEEGQIRFMPKAGTTAPVTIEKVTAGRYATETSGGRSRRRASRRDPRLESRRPGPDRPRLAAAQATAAGEVQHPVRTRNHTGAGHGVDDSGLRTDAVAKTRTETTSRVPRGIRSPVGGDSVAERSALCRDSATESPPTVSNAPAFQAKKSTKEQE